MEGWLPTAGRVLQLPAADAGARVVRDRVGSEVDTTYDSMLAKVIVWAPDRTRALGELDRALASFELLGVTTTTGFLRLLIATDEVRSGQIDTGLIERNGVPGSIDRRRGRGDRGGGC